MQVREHSYSTVAVEKCAGRTQLRDNPHRGVSRPERKTITMMRRGDAPRGDREAWMAERFRFISLVSGSRAHLAGVDEGYFEPLRFAATVGAMLTAAGLARTLHAPP